MKLHEITNEMIDTATTARLRALAREHLDGYAREATVARFELDDVVVNTQGALTAIDKVMAVLKNAYSAREPVVRQRYSGTELVVFVDDDTLRSALKYKSARALADYDAAREQELLDIEANLH